MCNAYKAEVDLWVTLASKEVTWHQLLCALVGRVGPHHSPPLPQQPLPPLQTRQRETRC